MRRRTFLGALAAGATLPPLAAGTNTATPTTTPLSPAFVVDAPGLTEAVVGQDGRYVYAATGDGLSVFDCDDVEEPQDLGKTQATMNGEPMTGLGDADVSEDRVLVAGPTTFVDDGQQSGAVVFDVSDPTNPEQVAAIQTDYAVHNAGIAGDAVFLTGTGLNDQPVVVYDISGERPLERAKWSVVDANDAWSGINQSLHQCHDVTARGDRAYVSFWDAGTWILDVSSLASPEPVAQIGGVDPATYEDASGGSMFSEVRKLPGNSHNTALSPDGNLLAVGREAFSRNQSDDRYGGPGGVELYDVSDETNPKQLTALQPPVVEDAEGTNHVATAHNCAFRGSRLYTSWYLGGVRVYDVSDPSKPADLGGWAAPLEASFWTAAPLDDGFVGASHQNPSASREARRNGENAKLYAFPEPSEENASPAKTLNVNATGVPANPPDYDVPTTTETTTADPTTTSEPTTTRSDSTTTDGTTQRATSPTVTDEASDSGVPGFGVGAAVAGATLVALHRLRGD